MSALVLVACARVADVAFSFDQDAGGIVDGGGTRDGMGDPGGEGEPCEDPAEKRCAGICMPRAPEVGCSRAGCEPCVADPNGEAVCSGGECALDCRAGFLYDGTRCVAAEAGLAPDCVGDCPVFRVTEYPTSSSSATWNVDLDQPLARDYFVIVRGSRNNNNPDQFYARLVQDPYGTGQLGDGNVSASQLRMNRSSGTNTWVGVVTVVECLRECDTAGFRLLDVRSFELSGTSGTLESAVPFTDVDRVMVVAGVHGAGVTNSSSSAGNAVRSHLDFYPSGERTLHWARPASGGTNRSTVMVVQWGSEWTVQRRSVSGSAWGSNANLPEHYDTAPIDPVPRASTWVWGTGYTTGTGSGSSAEGSIITLGDGVDVQAVESTVAVGQQMATTKTFTVYALTHPGLRVDHRLRPSESSGTTADIPTASAAGCGPQEGGRMAIAYNGGSSNDTWPAFVFSARYLDDTTIRMAREQNSSGNWAAWVQGIQFCDIVAE